MENLQEQMERETFVQLLKQLGFGAILCIGLFTIMYVGALLAHLISGCY